MHKILIVFFCILPIAVGIYAVPTMISGTQTLVAINQDKQNAIPEFTGLMNTILQHCTTATNDATCKETIVQTMQSCGYLGNPPICSDPRIQQILHS